MSHKASFSPRELETLDAAYHHALTKLLARYPGTGGPTKDALRHKITQLASYGMLDVVTLGDLALDLLAIPAKRPTIRYKRAPRRVT